MGSCRADRARSTGTLPKGEREDLKKATPIINDTILHDANDSWGPLRRGRIFSGSLGLTSNGLQMFAMED